LALFNGSWHRYFALVARYKVVSDIDWRKYFGDNLGCQNAFNNLSSRTQRTRLACENLFDFEIGQCRSSRADYDDAKACKNESFS